MITPPLIPPTFVLFVSSLPLVIWSFAMAKRSACGHYNQTCRCRNRSKHNQACSQRLSHPQYVHLCLDYGMLEIEFLPLVPRRDGRLEANILAWVTILELPYIPYHKAHSYGIP